MEPKKLPLSTNNSANSALEKSDPLIVDPGQHVPDVQNDSQLAALGNVSGRVSEVVGEIPSEALSTTSKSSSSQRPVTLSLEERKAKLLASLPSDQKTAENKMRREISDALSIKISALQKEANSSLSPFHLNRILQEIRHLKTLLLDLASAAFEYLKTLWLRIVHGLSI